MSAGTKPLLRRIAAADVRAAAPAPVDRATVERASEIVQAVRSAVDDAPLRAFVRDLDGRDAGAPLWIGREELLRVLRDDTSTEVRALLERTSARIDAFARAQVASLSPVDVPVPGGRAGHDVVPVESAGCYAPGGRYPLPSSVLMTAVTARAAGVGRVVVASPNPSPVVLAAAAVAGADGVLAAGGAHGIAALASGVPGVLEPVHKIVGPGNRWVTAAKQIVFGAVGIDLPAGPSELLVIADGSADPRTVAADLLAQAEHDPDARPMLVALDESLLDRVEDELELALRTLPTAEVARAALAQGFACVAADRGEAVEAADRIAPEHLQLSVADPGPWRAQLSHFGGLFMGEASAEVFGDYGAGPNHVLPTGGAARHSGGLSALDFLRVRTWMQLDDPGPLASDCAALAGLEGLAAHAAAAAARGSLRERPEAARRRSGEAVP